ncbi:MAG: DUF1499 domain-containing protein [Erythrobacter sp.]
MMTLPKRTKLVLALLAVLPVYFMIAALGTKFGIWDWKVGLMTLTLGGGLIVLALIALVALVSLILAIRTVPRAVVPLVVAILGLVAPVAALMAFMGEGAMAAENPIHDIAPDTANPPAFSPETLKARTAAGANPLSDYQVPLGQVPFYQKVGVSPELAVKSHAQIITDRKDRPAPLPLGGASKTEGAAAVAAAMAEMGMTEIRSNAEAGMVEGVAETFWFGFKDDVVARIGDAQIDFRSVSRVGVSDVGANTARINDLRARTAALLGAASR